MLQSLSFRDAVVNWPTRPTEVNGWGGHPYRFRCIVRHMGENSAQATVRFGRTACAFRAQRLTYTRGGHMALGREGNRNIQNFPRFGRGFDLRPYQPSFISTL